MDSQLRKTYNEKVRQELMSELGITNVMAVPKIEKITINVGLGEAKVNSALIEEFGTQISQITGQKTIVTKSKTAISNFKIRENMPIGLKVTLRDIRMWFFLEKLIHIVFPRVKDFRGVSGKSFDGNGNYNFGFKDQFVFPEIDSTKITKSHGLQITISTTSNKDSDAKLLLSKLGFPFMN